VILETAFEWFIVAIQDAVKFCWTFEAKCHLRLHLFRLRGSQHEFLSSCWMEGCGYCSHESRPNCCSSQQRDQSWRWQRFVSAIEELAEMNGRHTLLGSGSPPATAAAAVKASAEKGRTPFPQNSVVPIAVAANLGLGLRLPAKCSTSSDWSHNDAEALHQPRR